MKSKKNNVSVKENTLIKKNNQYTDIVLLCLCVTAVLFILSTFTGQWAWKAQPYNSYILQAQSWLHGRLDLGQDYSYLEIAVFGGKYYVSFPPFPSYVMLPFVLFGYTSCDSLIAFITSLAGAVYAFKIAEHFEVEKKYAVFFALFLTIASNWLLTAQNAWVWFIAQNMAFTLSLAAIYYALKNKAGLSLALWACAVGCRPLQIMYLPVLLYLIYKAHKALSPDDKIADIIKKRPAALIPMAVIALSYMILNYARFGNILEFGHTYLPEFQEAADGQFSLSYIPGNISSLLKMPSIKNGIWQYPEFNGMCIFMISPIFITYIVYIVRSFVSDTNSDMRLTLIIVVMSFLEILAITAHKTMGGSQFGNRYTNDILPMIFLCTAYLIPKNDRFKGLNYVLFFLGFTINIIGTANYFIK